MEQTPLKNLEDKLELLLKKYQLMQKENKLLKNSLSETETALAKSQKAYEALQLKLDAGIISAARTMDEHQQQLLQNRIDQYLQEINKCLLLLDA